jgi:hypothetical protein
MAPGKTETCQASGNGLCRAVQVDVNAVYQMYLKSPRFVDLVEARNLTGGAVADADTRAVGHGAGGTWSDFRLDVENLERAVAVSSLSRPKNEISLLVPNPSLA